MARKGWDQAIAKVERPDDWGVQVISSSDVRTLLARQHAAFVRLVKSQTPPSCMRIGYQHGYSDALRDVLAVLAKQKGGR